MSEDFPVLAGLRAGSLVAGYRLEAQVGAGGMAVVFRAREERLGRVVALKILSPALAADAGFRRRFIAESRAAAAVDDPHIIPVHAAGEADGVLFIAMRFVAAGDLRRVLEQEGPLEPGRAAEFISPVASALDAAHRAGLVHRDVKPANILVDAREDRPDHVYLSDFGVSKGAVSSVSVTGTGQFLGTPGYSAPEQVQGQVVDGRADQYALGCVAWQLLTGSVPFERDQGLAVLLAHLSEPPPLLSARRPGLPGAADLVLARAMAKVPEKRYGSCGDFADALREALGLAPYTFRGPAAAPGHPPAQIASQPGSSGLVAAGAEAAAVPADPPAAATIDWLPGYGPPGPPRVPAAAVIATGPARPGTGAGDGSGVLPPTASAVAEDGVPAATATAVPASQPARERGTAAEPVRLLVVLARLRWAFRRGHWAAPILSVIVVLVTIIGFSVYRLASSHGHAARQGAATSSHRAAAKAGAHSTPPKPKPSPAAAGPGVVSLENPGQWAGAAAWGPDGTLAVGAFGGADLWNVTKGTISAALIHPGRIGALSVAFGPGGTLAAADGNSTYVWNIAARKIAATFTDPASSTVISIAFAPDGNTLAAGDGNGSIYLWDVAARKIAATFTDPASRGIASVAFGPGGTTLAAGDSNGTTYLWHIATGTISAAFTDPASRGIEQVAFGPGGTTLAVGDAIGRTYLWDIATGKLSATLTDPASTGVISVAFAPGGATLAVADGDGSTYLWNIATGKIIATLTEPTQGNHWVVFEPGRTTLAITDLNGRIFLWDVARYKT